MKDQHKRITALTAYDFPTARALDAAGVDILLVGDSLGMVLLGYDNTLAVTMDDMLHHTRAVARGAERAMVVGDMPFMSYQINAEEALRNAGRFVQDAGAQAVKLEGGEALADTVRRIVAAGIPVMGHLGLTPQSVHQLGGFRVQGKTAEAASRLLEDARCLEQAGIFALVLEMVPRQLARLVTERLSIPTIGIGAGPECDGQILVTHDLIGLYHRPVPRFAKRYARVADIISEAVGEYLREVRAGDFPGEQHCFNIEDKVLADLY